MILRPGLPQRSHFVPGGTARPARIREAPCQRQLRASRNDARNRRPAANSSHNSCHYWISFHSGPAATPARREPAGGNGRHPPALRTGGAGDRARWPGWPTGDAPAVGPAATSTTNAAPGSTTTSAAAVRSSIIASTITSAKPRIATGDSAVELTRFGIRPGVDVPAHLTAVIRRRAG